MTKEILTICCLYFSIVSSAQTTFVKGSNVLELSGILNTYYSFIDHQGTSNNFGFDFRDARFILAGESGRRLKFQLMVDFSDLNAIDTTDGFVKDAYVNLDLPSKFDIFFGYQRVPFGRISNISIFTTVFNDRPTISSGALYYRRNLGVVLKKKLLTDRLNIFAGIFNARNQNRLSEIQINGLTYAIRIDYSTASTIQNEELDIRHSPIPVFSIGLNAMHSDHNQNLEFELFPLEIEGRKWITAIDMALFYQGFSFQFEATKAWAKNDQNIGIGFSNDFKSTGYHFSANYYFKKLRSVLGSRYEAFCPNDFKFDSNFKSVSFAYNYLFDQSQDVVLRLEYKYFLSLDDISFLNNSRQVHLGLQYKF